MRELVMTEMDQIDGGGWRDYAGGISCGISIMGTIAMAVSPDPITKVMLVTTAGTALGCAASLF